jgi:hypothetical protein
MRHIDWIICRPLQCRGTCGLLPEGFVISRRVFGPHWSTVLLSPSTRERIHPGTRYKGDRTGGRRSALCIRFAGECCHNWELVIQQSKGINLIQVRLLPESDEEFGV